MREPGTNKPHRISHRNQALRLRFTACFHFVRALTPFLNLPGVIAGEGDQRSVQGNM